MAWTPASWNTCLTPWCRGPVEGPGGSVEFFDGGEAYCIECDREYGVVIFDGGHPFLFDPAQEVRHGLAKHQRRVTRRHKRRSPHRGRR